LTLTQDTLMPIDHADFRRLKEWAAESFFNLWYDNNLKKKVILGFDRFY